MHDLRRERNGDSCEYQFFTDLKGWCVPAEGFGSLSAEEMAAELHWLKKEEKKKGIAIIGLMLAPAIAKNQKVSLMFAMFIIKHRDIRMGSSFGELLRGRGGI